METGTTNTGSTDSIRLTKHHGLGNDFLIALDPGVELSSAAAKQWCDRRTGIGADGLIHARSAADGNRWSMVLYNADGSRAEISGNGLRCLGQAIGMATGMDATGALTVDTDAGRRTLEINPSSNETWSIRVGMGTAFGPAVGPDVGPDALQQLHHGPWADAGVTVTEQLVVDIGNPHVLALITDS